MPALPTWPRREARRRDGIEAVAIVTPNHMHAPVAMQFLRRGIHVICDKPLTATLAEAKKLAKAAEASGALFVLTHNYTGYPMIRQAREMIASGELGEIRLVQVEYAQDWLSEPLEQTGQKQAGWRTDPKQTGAGGSTGDIGTHAFNLASFVTGLELESLAADLQTFVPGRRVDDNGHVLMRFKGGARGMLWCSQVAPGQRERAAAARLWHKGRDRMGAGGSELPLVHPARPAEAADHAGRGGGRGGGGPGHAACRRAIPRDIWKASPTSMPKPPARSARGRRARRCRAEVVYPTVRDGVAGVAFVDACVRSSARNAAWVSLNL